MRRYYTLLILLSMIFCSCDNFLEYKAGDILIPKTVENYKEFVYGEIIKEEQVNSIHNLEIMTDNVEESTGFGPVGDNRKDYWGYFTWQSVPERNYVNKIIEDKIWELYYHKILSCNVVLDNMVEMQGSENDKNVLKAEVLFLRAYSYLILANSYAKPYTTEENAKLDKSGIPINDKTGIEEVLYTRSSLFDVYTLVENDLKEAIDLFSTSDYENNVFRPSLDAAYLILSRTYLYQKKYEECRNIATELINSTTRSIPDYENYVKVIVNPFTGEKIMIGSDLFTLSNTGIIFTNGKDSNSEYINSAKYCLKASTELMSLFTGDDYRKAVGFDPVVKTKPWKFKAEDVFDRCLRIEEAYLNRAEALAELNEGDMGKSDILNIRKNRMPSDFELPMDTQEQAKKAVREERRRELCFEDQRWFDLRRWMNKEIVHTYTLGDKTITYTLKKNSEAYTLPIPQEVILQNDKIENINRPDRKND